MPKVGIIAIVFGLVGFALAIVALNGCSVFESACAKTIPAVTTATVLLDDAQMRVDRAEAIILASTDPRVREEGAAIIAKLRAALSTTSEVLDAALTSCSQPDPQTVFATFVALWPKLVALIGTFGGTADSLVGTPLVMR